MLGMGRGLRLGPILRINPRTEIEQLVQKSSEWDASLEPTTSNRSLKNS
jgi:hypothetical protein